MSGSSEIVTIQAGNYSNCVGTHWWNLQESSFCFDQNSSLPLDINHDILFREGVNYKGETTFTPRLILIDLKDNLKSIRQECPLYRFPDDDHPPLWEGPVKVMKKPPVRKNPFLESDGAESVDDAGETSEKFSNFNSPSTVWCDFLKTNLHPKSFCLLNDVTSEYFLLKEIPQHRSCESTQSFKASAFTLFLLFISDKSPLEMYSSGDEIYKKSGKDMIEDTIRKMTEECDFLQGFQLIYDSCNGFSGIINWVLQYLDDEFSRRASICFPTFQGNKPPPYEDIKEQINRSYAILLSMSSMTSYSSLFSPLALCSDVVKFSEPYARFPFLKYDPNIEYQTSSILAAGIETLTSQYRLKNMKFSLSDVTSAMSAYSRKLVCSSLCLPFPLSEDAFLSTMVQKDVAEYYAVSISPFYNPESEKTLYQSAVLRGVPQSKISKQNKSYYAIEPEQVFGEYLNKYSPSSVTTATIFSEKCTVGHPFPKIFKNSVGSSGFLYSEPPPKNEGVEKVPVAASFSSSDSAAKFLDSLLAEADKPSFKEYIKCAESTYEKDDFIEVIQNLIGLRDNYEDY